MNRRNSVASPITLFKASLEGGNVAFTNPTLVDNVSIRSFIPMRPDIDRGLVLQFSMASRFGIKDDRLKVESGLGLLYCQGKTIDDFANYMESALRENPDASVVSLNGFIKPVYTYQRRIQNTPS